jgi:hypothetical protein
MTCQGQTQWIFMKICLNVCRVESGCAELWPHGHDYSSDFFSFCFNFLALPGALQNYRMH